MNPLPAFTPDTSGFDRDQLFFRAGQASVPSGIPWKQFTILLACSQVVWLSILLWPTTASTISKEQFSIETEPAPRQSHQEEEPSSPALLIVQNQWLQMENNPFLPPASETFVSQTTSQPTWSVGSLRSQNQTDLFD